MAVRKRRTVPEYVTRVEFALSDTRYPFVAAASHEGSRVMLEEFIPRGAETYAEFFSVTGVDRDRVLSAASAHDSAEARLLNRYEDGGLFEFEVDGDCPAVFLCKRNALPRDVFAVDGEGRIVAEIPSTEDAAEIVDEFLDEHSDGELVVKRDQPYVTPMFGHREYRHAIDERLTDRQQEVLAVAHETGYYDWPRRITGEGLADELSISAATLHKHLRAAERKLITFLFESPAASVTN